MTEAAIIARDIEVPYPDGRVVRISGLPLELAQGERAALVGPNGCGKSTLLRAVLGLNRVTSGEVQVLGLSPTRQFDQLRVRLGVVLQDVDAQLLAPTVREDLAFGLGARSLSDLQIKERVEAIADRLEISSLLDRVPHNLSTGERRRVALAGALVTEPELLILDEPFAGLDPRSRRELVRLLEEEHARGVTLLLTTHEVEELQAAVDTVFVMQEGGVLAARGTPSEIFRMTDLLTVANIRAPQIAQLADLLRERGITLPDTADLQSLADALAARLMPPSA